MATTRRLMLRRRSSKVKEPTKQESPNNTQTMFCSTRVLFHMKLKLCAYWKCGVRLHWVFGQNSIDRTWRAEMDAGCWIGWLPLYYWVATVLGCHQWRARECHWPGRCLPPAPHHLLNIEKHRNTYFPLVGGPLHVTDSWGARIYMFVTWNCQLVSWLKPIPGMPYVEEKSGASVMIFVIVHLENCGRRGFLANEGYCWVELVSKSQK